jgi:hypothetical protein
MFGRLKDGVGLSPEERQRAIEEPGESWRTWFLTTGLKPWIVLLLLIIESLGIVSMLQVLSGAAALLVLGPLVALLYVDILFWNFLWRVPSLDEWKTGEFRNSWWQPFKIGRWTHEYAIWKSGKGKEIAMSDVNPHDFL